MIEISVNYQMEGYSTVLNKKNDFFVKIDSSPVFVKINVPTDVMSNEEFDISIEVLSNSNTVLNNLVLIGKYPNGFELVDNDPDPVFSTNYKNIFRIDELKVGEKKIIVTRGKLIGENSETKVLSFSVGDTNNDNNEIRTVFFNADEKIVIKKPSLDLNLICLNKNIESDPLIINAGENLDCEFILKNNLTTKVTDISISMSYNDNLIKEENIIARTAYIDSNNNNIL
ncbi:hypothetical protein LDC_0598 [sediment metagenome]|uniref:Uncharacterized protein n=1 Tax=sediment metagenome TaxID=749907 RepID=D9PGF1_9ZZZZ